MNFIWYIQAPIYEGVEIPFQHRWYTIYGFRNCNASKMISTTLKEEWYTWKKIMLCYLSILYKVKNPEGNMKDHCYMIK